MGLYFSERLRKTFHTDDMYKTTQLLSIITGKKRETGFGEPFIEAFTVYFKENGKEERITATGIACSLFLSCLKLKFPSDKLNTFVRNIREELPFIIFDCKSYEEIYAAMPQEEMLLLDSNMQYSLHKVSKEDIFETFDFITNI